MTATYVQSQPKADKIALQKNKFTHRTYLQENSATEENVLLSKQKVWNLWVS